MDKSKSALKESALSKGTKLKYGKKEYVIEKVLGSGSFGIIYKAYTIELDGNIKRKYYYAIKEYFQNGFWRDKNNMKVCYADTFKADFEEGFSEFKSEANKLISMAGKSPYIVPVNECFQMNNTIYYVMEYLNGEDLEKAVPKGVGISEAKALSLLVPVAKAVKLLHDNRIMHLDIKPDNIVLHHDHISESEETYPVLIDFGIAMRFDKEGKPKTRKVDQKGTIGFAPLEQNDPIEHFDARFDVYALGATLFYLLTGIQPKSSSDVTDSYIVESLPSNISERTRNAVKNAMQKDKGNRLKSVQEFLNALEDSFYLPDSSILSSPRQKYKILRVEDVNDYSITYKGCINYSLDGVSSLTSEKNPTKVAYEYLIQEFYLRNTCKRSGVNVSIASSPFVENSLNQFKSEAVKMGITDSSPFKIAENGVVEKEMFAANGTYYLCKRKIRKTPWQQEILAFVRNQWKQLATASLLVVIVALGVLNIDKISGFLGGLLPTESEKLTSAIEKQDFERLRRFADKDSSRAYVPLAGIYLEKEDTLNAYKTYKKASDNAMVKQIEDALMEHFNESISSLLKQYDKADDSVKDNYLIEAIKISDKGKAVASNYGFLYNRLDLSNTVDKRFDEWVKAGDKINLRETKIYNYQHALRLKEDSYVRNKLDALLAVQSSQTTSQQLSQPSSNQSTTQSVSVSPNTIEITDDQKYEAAIKNSNWQELKKLADKGYSKACIPLARHYLKSSTTHAEAEKYALKAVKINKQEVENIINLLDSYGYYDDKEKPIL